MAPPEEKIQIAGLEDALKLASQRKLPPVENWHPEDCGEMDMVIRADGSWWHEGAPINRPALVRLFSTILRKDEDGVTYLVTPVEKIAIKVEDSPFLAVHLQHKPGDETGPETFLFTTNLGDQVALSHKHPLKILENKNNGQPRPYILVRGQLEARLTRPVFYELVEKAQIRPDPTNGQKHAYITSKGETFDLGNVE